MTTPLPPDDLPDTSETEFDALFRKPTNGRSPQSENGHTPRVLHSDLEREALAHSVFETQRGDFLDENAREVIRYMDALKQLEDRANHFLADATGLRRKRLEQSAQIRRRARDLWNSEIALFLIELRLDLAALMENEYGKAALEIVKLLRDQRFPPQMEND